MSREQKLSLVIAFGLVLLVGVLISDHLSRARQLDLVPVGVEESNILALDVHAPEGTIRPTRTRSLLDPEGDGGVIHEPIRDPAHDRGSNARPGALPTEPPAGPSRQGVAERGRDLADARPSTGRTIDGPIEIRQGSSSMIDRLVDNGGSLIEHALESGRRMFDEPRSAAIDDGRRADATPGQDPAPNADLAEPFVWHVVAKGESLSKIASKYYGKATDWTRIAAVNDVRENGVVHVGERLRIPGIEAPRAREQAARLAGTYTVRAGDTLGQIAMKTMGTVREMPRLMELNGLDNANVIRVGMVLKLPEAD
ncbi:MAG: LysM peptidoglycan-binding domain-containing protein [Phycisphaerales bacterium]|nr:LysM peptidoglycan-binding domain-containing protein [Phycisphaerales bacterium]